MKLEVALQRHQTGLRDCRRCPDMIGPVVTGQPVGSKVMLIGQAPGDREGPAGKPFAWTAGKTLFKWFAAIGVDEDAFRSRVYMAAVCRCFPGKKPGGGDRVPSEQEMDRCGEWLDAEFKMLQPELVIPVGKLAIGRLMAVDKLSDVIGKLHCIDIKGKRTTVIPLPHPSGASTWHRTDPGKTLLQDALSLLSRQSAWRDITSE